MTLTSVAATLPLNMNDEGKRYVSHQRPRTASKSSASEAKAMHRSRLGMAVAQYGGIAYLINYCLAEVVNDKSELGEKEESARLSPRGNDRITLSTLSSRAMISPKDTVRKEDEEMAAHPGQVMDVAREIVQGKGCGCCCCLRLDPSATTASAASIVDSSGTVSKTML
mmetsp:Transcript_40488/g.61389  ORF Transcript_40488/g.61389 Transcript_40488/m.61389 type:complete len:168 (+) Transcript_40488:2-505(+)